eukprot:CAMPEP_0174284734 /NCGR_PEP_ID=MMETSP0809-20121228/6478_1 /TAXON_ID=73025 ORGANISM="Eutreptiella gymnastica-like, Strain CCMP1594" /NCGR_SAMPLE_ID=MMETSP0809 /ASSEMBLY_ACC=CAM_ASM_000658 /LENGTH=405 /DNA_ID=CAMNT_0015380349 /DNA_START=199 /DNA_END=1416 /DNA_ORIENTATION=+
MGLNIAYQLKRRNPDHSVLLLESTSQLGNGSSGYSTGFLRAYYSFDETMRLALDGIHAYKNWARYTKLDNPEVYFTHTGALWMLGYQKQQNVEMQGRLAQFGVESEVLDEAAFVKKMPLMSPEPFPDYDMETGELREKDYGDFSAVWEYGAGHVDSTGALRDLLDACTRDGVETRFKTKVASITKDGDKVVGVQLQDGTQVNGGTVVNASGPWFQALCDSVGVTCSTTSLPTRIQVGHKMIPKEYHNLPFTADGWGASGIYFMPRAANGQLIFGSVAHRFESEIVDPDNYNTNLDPDFKQDYLRCLFHRLPGLETSGEIVGFSHMYTVNQEDVHPVIGESAVKGLYLCHGFSGHGFKLGPAVGSMVAQQITGTTLKDDEFETTAPLHYLAVDREPLKIKVKTHFA